MGDPLLRGNVDWGDVALMIGKVGFGFVVGLLATVFMVWFERKLIGRMQNRVGPKEAGPFGIIQGLADGIKFFFKEDNRPANADPLIFRLAPYIATVTALLSLSVVPIAGDFSDGGDGTVSILGQRTYGMVADPPAGILFLLAMSSIAVYGVMLAGWASGSKYPLLGSVRASAQAISYEAALGLAVAAVVLVSGTLSTHGIVMEQAGGIRNWGFLSTGLLPFVIFLIAATAELNRPPFDLVEAEQELVGGFHTEYASIRFALFFLAEFMNVVTMSAIMVTVFFGGPLAPFESPVIDWIPGPVWFVAKLLVFLFIFVWFRATLPRLRYDQLMNLGWKVMIPAALGWLLALASIRLARLDENSDWNLVVLIGGGLAIFGVSLALLLVAIRAGDRTYDAELEAEAARR
ncbi:MAG: NADH-quinone oxidoreductase subunit NuoH [Actinomycetota bacterium]